MASAGGCANRNEATVDTWDNGAYHPVVFKAFEIAGEREGATTAATAVFTFKDGARLQVDLQVAYNPTPVLASGRWQLDGPFAGEGDVRAESIKFLGGQGEAPSLGGRFILSKNGTPRFRVFIPSRPLPHPKR
jgi:hypothetical protein